MKVLLTDKDQSKKKVLVTGSEGSLAQAVIPLLQKQGYKVFGIDLASDVFRNKPYWYRRVNLLNDLSVTNLFSDVKPDYVIQAAATVYGVAGFHRQGADILAQDTRAHANVLKACVDFGVKRVVFLSSSMVYERAVNTVEDDLENNPPPLTGYGLSKFMNERLTIEYQKQYGLNYTIWRPFNIITPYEIANKDQGVSHVFADFIRNIVGERLNPLPIIGDGDQVRCFTWIDDVAEAIAKYSFDDRSLNDAFNLGRYEPVTMKELAQRIYTIANRIYLGQTKSLEFETVKRIEGDVLCRVVNPKKAEDVFEWAAKTTLDESITECILEYYRRLKW